MSLKVTMRLYRMHDLDLLYLYKMPNVSIQKIIKIVLKNYVVDRTQRRGIVSRVEIPKIEHTNPLPNSALLHIYLNEGEDDDVIEWINQTPKGVRNSMLKNILRGYLDFPVTTPYELEVEQSTTVKSKSTIQDLNKSLSKSQSKTTRKKAEPKNEKPTDKMVDEILSKPTEPSKPKTSKKPPVKTEEADAVLNTKSPASETPATPSVSVTSNSEDTNEDFFDSFEQLMQGF